MFENSNSIQKRKPPLLQATAIHRPHRHIQTNHTDMDTNHTDMDRQTTPQRKRFQKLKNLRHANNRGDKQTTKYN